MRRRPLVLVLACAALLGVAPAAAAPAADPPPDPFVGIVIELPANHGLRGHLEASRDGAELRLTRHGHQVAYEVEKGVEATESGLRMKFGKLGSIDATFTPTKTLGMAEPPDDCVGQPHVRREGIFAGTIEFHGERGFVQVDATRVKGKMKVIPEWECRRRGGPGQPSFSPVAAARRGEAPLAAVSRRVDPEPEAEPATLAAFSRGCRCGLLAIAARYPSGRGLSYFLGAVVENREGMKITRFTIAHAGPASFAFDHDAGTATVRPPAPFTGHATFTRRPHAPDLWRSTLRVPVLGAAPLVLHGAGFRARLLREFPGD